MFCAVLFFFMAGSKTNSWDCESKKETRPDCGFVRRPVTTSEIFPAARRSARRDLKRRAAWFPNARSAASLDSQSWRRESSKKVI